MTRRTRLRMLVVIVVASAALAGSCRPNLREAVPANAVLRLIEAKRDTGIRIRIAMLADTVYARDTQPVEVLVAITNGPLQRKFDNHPGRFHILVTDWQQHQARSLGGSGPVLGSLGDTRILLPANATLLQRHDLRCIRDNGAYRSAAPEPPSNEGCLARYAFDSPGRYRVIVEYQGYSNKEIVRAVDEDMSATQLSKLIAPSTLADTITLNVASDVAK